MWFKIIYITFGLVLKAIKLLKMFKLIDLRPNIQVTSMDLNT
jgi:hypothetical protein